MTPETDELAIVIEHVSEGIIAPRATAVLLGTVTVEVRDLPEAAVRPVAPLVAVPGLQYVAQPLPSVPCTKIVKNFTHLHPDGEP